MRAKKPDNRPIDLVTTWIKLRIISYNTQLFSNIKKTKSTILCDPIHAQMAMTRFASNPLKLCLIKYELDINVYHFENWLFSIKVSLHEHLVIILNQEKKFYFPHFLSDFGPLDIVKFAWSVI